MTNHLGQVTNREIIRNSEFLPPHSSFLCLGTYTESALVSSYMIHNPLFSDACYLELGHILNHNRQSKLNSDKQQHFHQENTGARKESSFINGTRQPFPQQDSLFSSSLLLINPLHSEK